MSEMHKGSRKKSDFFIGRTTKRGEGVKPRTTKGKTTFFKNHLNITKKSYDH